MRNSLIWTIYALDVLILIVAVALCVAAWSGNNAGYAIMGGFAVAWWSNRSVRDFEKYGRP